MQVIRLRFEGIPLRPVQVFWLGARRMPDKTVAFSPADTLLNKDI